MQCWLQLGASRSTGATAANTWTSTVGTEFSNQVQEKMETLGRVCSGRAAEGFYAAGGEDSLLFTGYFSSQLSRSGVCNKHLPTSGSIWDILFFFASAWELLIFFNSDKGTW